jgi:hypothetical protein
MTKPAECRVVDMPDGTFTVIAVLASGKVFRRVGLRTMAEVEESVEMLRDIMSACGVPVTCRSAAGERSLPARETAPTGRG